MILATALVLQRLLTLNVSSRESVIRTVILWIAVTAFGILHCRINDLNIHSTVFTAMIFYIVYRTRVMIKSVKDPERKKRAGRLARWGSGTFFDSMLLMLRELSKIDRDFGNVVCAVAGFALWVIDSIACDQLRWARRQVGMPFGFVLEFHGW